MIAIFAVILWGVISVVNTVRKTTGDLVAPVNVLNTQAAGIFNTTPTVFPDPVTIVNEVQSLARLETIQYSLEKVVTAETGSEELRFLFGDKLLFVAHGEVIAGIDLAKLNEEDLTLRSGTLYVSLPEVEIFTATLNNEKSYVYDRETGLLSKGNLDLETLARQAAEEAILAAALEDGILEQAEVNAADFLESFFHSLGYPEVVLEFSDEN
ncbi:MAG: DUF4230 domain-containing protein [candidate division Zixibacteria bacterium]|nr:DUF4230 domain-containing protein [candidate division Zixibacteria bacterium]